MGIRRLVGAFAAGAAVVLAGCALRAADVRPLPTDPAEFGGWTCERIRQEMDFVQRHAVRLAYEFDSRTGNNVMALGLGVAAFWPALLAIRSGGSEDTVIAALKGRHDALVAAAAARPCEDSADPAEAAGVPAAVLRVGDQLVYEQRVRPRGPAQAFRLRVAAIGREGLQLDEVADPRPVPAGGAPPDPVAAPAWRSDRLGNLRAAPRSPVWPDLLRDDLVLGAAVSGELRDVDDAAVGARVSGQVVSVAPQVIAGRRFDVAVIDLSGEAGGFPIRTRLDGVLVVDRLSGLLLRLDLASAAPGFQLQRRLMRIEAAP